MKGEDIANRARKSISKFCMEECKSYCCRKGHLPLFDHEVKLIFGDKSDLNKQLDDKFSMDLSKGCPRLKDFKCTIHNNTKRPMTCKEYPIFVIGDFVRLSSRCLAVRNNLLYPFVKEFMSAGYHVIESKSFEDSDIYPPLSRLNVPIAKDST